jgi:hypothetical protein
MTDTPPPVPPVPPVPPAPVPPAPEPVPGPAAQPRTQPPHPQSPPPQPSMQGPLVYPWGAGYHTRDEAGRITGVDLAGRFFGRVTANGSR